MSNPRAIAVAIIDDDESLCRALARLLQVAGFRPLTFLSAESFLDSPDRRDMKCLLVDVQLGGMSGLALHRQLSAEGETTPVIYITGHDDQAVRIQAVKNGCAGLFPKGVPGATLVEALRRVTMAP